MVKPQSVELLAPAKDLTCGIEAINHGADAVYIGAPKFGARAAAGNSPEDIRALCEYAHSFDARVYIALNTILKEEELAEVEKMIHSLYHAGADALIIQDMGITRLDLPPIPLHASTQTDNRTLEKVKFLEQAGFSQVVLARELPLKEIRHISQHTNVPLEVFVHGALCVSYSGQCYLSAALSGRSANRGECAQYCRLPYQMEDATGKEIVNGKHLLSLKDMNRSDDLEAFLDAGVSSFKIEGRLKDVSYVKNITAYYRQQLDKILICRPEFRRSSSGTSTYSFKPMPEKSFNRGFTSYFLRERTDDITSFDTPKSLGSPVGKIKEVNKNFFTIQKNPEVLNNGDGLAFFNHKGELIGCRINKIEGEQIYPFEMPSLVPGTIIYRNYDRAFEKILEKASSERKINIDVELGDNPFGFTLQLSDETGARVIITEPSSKEIARIPQEENIKKQLSKVGNTFFQINQLSLSLSDNWFIPSSVLSAMRRKAIEKLEVNRKIRYRREVKRKPDLTGEVKYPENTLTYLGNVSNSKAHSFYNQYGVSHIEPAYELNLSKNVPLMFTKHCLRYSFGWCPVYQKRESSYKEPYYLVYKNTRLELKFDCKNCLMTIWKED